MRHHQKSRFIRSRRIVQALVAAVAALLVPVVAGAHPLGNFTVNRYSRLEIGREQIAIFYVVDMAEIPTFQLQPQIDTDGNGRLGAAEQEAFLAQQVAQIASQLHLIVDGQALALAPHNQELGFPEGQGGLSTLRLSTWFTAQLPQGSGAREASYRDTNFAERLGWTEVVVRGTGAELLSSSAPVDDLSQELRSYPEDLLQSPPSLTSATFRFEPGAASATQALQPAQSTSYQQVDNSVDNFSSLVTAQLTNPLAVLIALVGAFGLGAAHALAPGHGKTIVAAYLVGSRGTARHALFLGLTTTITHTAGVFALGFITLFISQFILPEQLYPWLSVLSGLMVLVIGFTLLQSRMRGFYRQQAHANDDHAGIDGTDMHSHGYGVYHSHSIPSTDAQSPTMWRNLLLLGVSGGLLPCPSALVVLLSAISLGRVGFGLLLIIAFSLGLAGVLTLIGVLLVHASRWFSRLPIQGPIFRILPLASALVIIVAGIGITAQALMSATR